MLCQQCQRNEANCHLTSIGPDNRAQSKNLCRACYEAGSPQVNELVTQRETRCSYCGGWPSAGGTDLFESVTGVQAKKFWCLACATEYSRFVLQQLQLRSPSLTEAEDHAYLRTVNEQTEQYMKQWVAKRSAMASGG